MASPSPARSRERARRASEPMLRAFRRASAGAHWCSHATAAFETPSHPVGAPMTGPTDDLSVIDLGLEPRAVTFENPTGERGAGGRAARGRKGAPSRRLRPGERVTIVDLDGPGTIRHLWLTIPPAPPEVMRAVVLEVFYDGAAEPSVSVP